MTDDPRSTASGAFRRVRPRSEIVRIALIYLGVAWLLVQVANTLEEALDRLIKEFKIDVPGETESR